MELSNVFTIVRCGCARQLVAKNSKNKMGTVRRTVTSLQWNKISRRETALHRFYNTHKFSAVNEPLPSANRFKTLSKRDLSSHAIVSSVRSLTTVLGIETSCDDTGAAVVDSKGNILGEGLHTQTRVHVEAGGIIPPIARDLHKDHIEDVVTTALTQAGMVVQDIDAIATTVKPGLIMSLDVGMKFTKNLIQETKKPFIPIHHMEAHALTARMIESVPFPFLVLLMSGGHCLLTVARDVNDFLLLGKCLDVAPGDSIDKVARFMGLKNHPECQGLSGGQAIELLAAKGNPRAFEINPKMNHQYNCDFSFAGSRTSFEAIIRKQLKEHGIEESSHLPNLPDICASFQYFLLRMIANRVRRAILYCDKHSLLPKTQRTLVVSGGVASNLFLRSGLQRVCEAHNLSLVCPPPKLCTDNGVMIAWNGVEKLKLGRGFEDINTVNIQAKCPLGRDISEDVANAQIRVERMKLLE